MVHDWLQPERDPWEFIDVMRWKVLNLCEIVGVATTLTG